MKNTNKTSLPQLKKTIKSCVSKLSVAAFVIVAYPVDAKDISVQIPEVKEQFEIYLLMGQSNMVGRGTIHQQQRNEHVLTLDYQAQPQWQIATDPLHNKTGRTEPGVGPGMSFAAEMTKQDQSITIGLVPCAVGGTAIELWLPGHPLYNTAIARGKEAMKKGVIKGVLWHQGETDAEKNPNYAAHYDEHLTSIIEAVREDLQQPHLPFVVGEIGQFLKPERFPFAESVRDKTKTVASTVNYVGFASSQNLSDRGDALHFSTESQIDLGKRFANAMVSVQKQP